MIRPQALFATPESLDALMKQIEPLGPEAILAHGLTWNYLAAEIEKLKPEPVTVVWGEEASRRYGAGENRPCRLNRIGSVDTYQFSTMDDYQQAMQLWSDSDGWMGSTYVEPGSFKQGDRFSDWQEGQAVEEGWAIFVSHEGLRLERIDELEVFDCDPAAWQYVVNRAKAGSKYHQKALEIVGNDNPMERDAIREETGYVI